MSAIVGATNAIGGAVVTAANSMGWFVPMLVAAVAYFQYEEIMSPEARPIDIPTSSFLEDYDFIIIGMDESENVFLCELNLIYFS